MTKTHEIKNPDIIYKMLNKILEFEKKITEYKNIEFLLDKIFEVHDFALKNPHIFSEISKLLNFVYLNIILEPSAKIPDILLTKLLTISQKFNSCIPQYFLEKSVKILDDEIIDFLLQNYKKYYIKALFKTFDFKLLELYSSKILFKLENQEISSKKIQYSGLKILSILHKSGAKVIFTKEFSEKIIKFISENNLYSKMKSLLSIIINYHENIKLDNNWIIYLFCEYSITHENINFAQIINYLKSLQNSEFIFTNSWLKFLLNWTKYSQFYVQNTNFTDPNQIYDLCAILIKCKENLKICLSEFYQSEPYKKRFLKLDTENLITNSFYIKFLDFHQNLLNCIFFGSLNIEKIYQQNSKQKN